MANFVENTACPKCREHGKDRKGDNLGVWDNGSKYCWSCGYWEPPTKLSPQRALKRPTRSLNDVVATIPSPHYKNLLERGLNDSEISKWYGYSPSMDRVVFQFYNFMEARSWRKDEVKSITYGSKPYTCIPTKEERFKDWIVIVEDAISAIKVARYVDCMPLFGSNIPGPVVGNAWQHNLKIAVWLDFDKAKNTFEYVQRFQNRGVYSKPIVTKEDPKDHPNIEDVLSRMLT